MPALTVHASSQTSNTSFMPYRPAGRPISQAAARSAPRAKIIRSVVRCVRFQTLAGRREGHRVLADNVAGPDHRKADAAGPRATSAPCRSKTATSFKVWPRDFATISPKLNAVPRGHRACPDGAPQKSHIVSRPQGPRCLRNQLTKVATPTLVLGAIRRESTLRRDQVPPSQPRQTRSRRPTAAHPPRCTPVHAPQPRCPR